MCGLQGDNQLSMLPTDNCDDRSGDIHSSFSGVGSPQDRMHPKSRNADCGQ